MSKKKPFLASHIGPWVCNECKGVHIGMDDADGNLKAVAVMDPQGAREFAIHIFELADEIDPDGVDEVGVTTGNA